MKRFGPILAVGVTFVLAAAIEAMAAPFAYVAHDASAVTVIDTATNTVVATISAFGGPLNPVVSPDGSRVYVANSGANTVSVVDAATNTIVATVPVGATPLDMAVTPDGSRLYVTNGNSNTVSVVATATNAVTATIPVGNNPDGVDVSPDGSHVYVTNYNDNTVSVIATASNTVVATVPVAAACCGARGVTVTPDGSSVYANNGNGVVVIATATNTVTATIPNTAGASNQLTVSPDGSHVYALGGLPGSIFYLYVISTATNTVTTTLSINSPCTGTYGSTGIALTPDGSRAYFTCQSAGLVAVLDTATNSIIGTIGGLGFSNDRDGPGKWIGPTPRFASFTAKLDNVSVSTGSYQLTSTFTLGTGSTGINPLTQPVTIQVGPSSITIPAGSFQQNKRGFAFFGTIGGAGLEVQISPTSTPNTYTFKAQVTGTNLSGIANPVPVTLTIGNNTGTTSVTATIGQ